MDTISAPSVECNVKHFEFGRQSKNFPNNTARSDSCELVVRMNEERGEKG